MWTKSDLFLSVCLYIALFVRIYKCLSIALSVCIYACLSIAVSLSISHCLSLSFSLLHFFTSSLRLHVLLLVFLACVFSSPFLSCVYILTVFSCVFPSGCFLSAPSSLRKCLSPLPVPFSSTSLLLSFDFFLLLYSQFLSLNFFFL